MHTASMSSPPPPPPPPEETLSPFLSSSLYYCGARGTSVRSKTMRPTKFAWMPSLEKANTWCHLGFWFRRNSGGSTGIRASSERMEVEGSRRRRGAPTKSILQRLTDRAARFPERARMADLLPAGLWVTRRKRPLTRIHSLEHFGPAKPSRDP
uniref:Uncharacterized protein n=1 Tax=Ananas comosus var. bracteatus TaxID=296719 RepID=A0A6V7PQ28_ANACO|nr:unnamed protein product [Ananas comosus var. bracteatus]